MDRAEQLRKLMAMKARHQRQLDDALEAIVQINDTMVVELHHKIDIVSIRIKNELNDYV